MGHALPARPLRRMVGAAAALVLLVACEGRASTLDPAGPRAEAAVGLHWIMFALAAVVMAIVLGLLAWALVRRGREADRAQRGVAIVVLGGIVLPLVILPVVWALTIGAMAREHEPEREVVAVIDVEARQWSYEVGCAGDGESSINELHIPVGEPVRLRLTSHDVIHSFWAPQLAGKQDMVPGEVNELWLEASESGTYLVQCAEFCGLRHAEHVMTIHAGDAGDCGTGGASGAGSCCG